MPGETLAAGHLAVGLDPHAAHRLEAALAGPFLHAGKQRGVVLLQPREGLCGRLVEGEVGVAVGTGGYRSIFGTAVMPLGQSGAVALSVENTQNDPLRYYRRR